MLSERTSMPILRETPGIREKSSHSLFDGTRVWLCRTSTCGGEKRPSPFCEHQIRQPRPCNNGAPGIIHRSMPFFQDLVSSFKAATFQRWGYVLSFLPWHYSEGRGFQVTIEQSFRKAVQTENALRYLCPIPPTDLWLNFELSCLPKRHPPPHPCA